MASKDGTTNVAIDIADIEVPNVNPFCRVFKSGRIVPLDGSPGFVPAGVDPVTGVVSKDVTINSDTRVKARLYLPPGLADDDIVNKKLPILVFYHGGAFFLLGDQACCETYNNFLIALVFEANIVAVSVNYRLAEQAKLPAAWDDCVAALKWVFSCADPWVAEHGDLEHVFLAGDSAGGNITHNVAMQLEANGIPQVEGVALLCPYFWGSQRIGAESFIDNVIYSTGFELAGMTDMDDPRVNPVAEDAPSLAGLGCQKAFVCTGGVDELRWRGMAYSAGLIQSEWGGVAMSENYVGMGHVGFINDLDSPDAKDVIAKLVALFNSK